MTSENVGEKAMMRSRKNLILILSATFVLMTLMVVFSARVVFRTAFSSVQELGDDKTSAITADLENYLDTAKSVLWVAADTVDHMASNGASSEEIIEYITRESSGTEEQFDESYTGIYGVVNDVYVDGVGWAPPADYDPKTRDWYKFIVAHKGEVVIVPPYVDAQTGNVIISVGKALSDNKNALALDLTLNGVQEIVEDIQINGYGYGYVVNKDGMVIAHHDRRENGKNYNDLEEQHDLFQKVVKVGKGHFTTNIDGKKCTVFVDEVMDQWYLVVITKNSELYSAPMMLLFVTIIIAIIVFILISTFYLLGYRSERKNYLRMEEMKESERKKDYEAKVLKLEKSAADSANKAKSDFLADMSHEIRTPINAILGMNEMILHESKEPNTLDYSTNIKSAGKTLLSIINTILDFSKIEDGKMNLVPAEFEIKILVNGLVNSISERAKTKGLAFKIDLDESVPSKLLGDDVRISQVIMNLLTNAVKYTEKGYVQLSIKNQKIENNRCNLLISVKDTGIGVRKEDIDKLSISFERVDEKKNRHIEGTGLGISIVTRLLIMMGSELKIKSEYGVGSEFYFELPLEIVDKSPVGEYSVTAKEHHSKSAASTVTLTVPDAKIILTDDNEVNRKVAANLMKLFGIKPTICGSGAETIKVMKEQHFDMLFLDHMMPEMDGLETLKYLKDNNLVGDTKVIALTANAVVGAREQYLEAGFDDYLSKPIELDGLEKIFKKYLTGTVAGDSENDMLPETESPVQMEETVSVDDLFGAVPDDEPEKDQNRTKSIDGKNDSEKSADPEDFEIMTFEVTEGDEMETGGKLTLEGLEKIGLNTVDGLTYCGNDEEFYLEIINDYVDAAPEKIGQLDGFLKADNLKDYKILIHSIKSASKTIGATDMFEKAKGLEEAAAAGDGSFVKSHHEAVMNEYKALVDSLK